jgi:hypothetical protein
METIFVIVLTFNVGGIAASVLPNEHKAFYPDRASCERMVPVIRKRWEAIQARAFLPSPDSITCEKLEYRR